MNTISQSDVNTIGTSSCSSWQILDSADTHVTRWVPDFYVQTCHSCHIRFQQWSILRKHHCRSMFFSSNRNY